MALISLFIPAVLGLAFICVDAVSLNRLSNSGAIVRNVRNAPLSFNTPPQFPTQQGFAQPQPPQQQRPGIQATNIHVQPLAAQPTGTEIRESIGKIDKPTVNVNRNTGASSSQSVSNAVLVNRPTGVNDKTPISLKTGQGLSLAFSIQGPLGAAQNDTFTNTQLFNKGENDFGQGFANTKDGQSNTGTNIHLEGKPGSGMASATNQASVNAFNTGSGTGTRGGTATAMSDAQG